MRDGTRKMNVRVGRGFIDDFAFIGIEVFIYHSERERTGSFGVFVHHIFVITIGTIKNQILLGVLQMGVVSPDSLTVRGLDHCLRRGFDGWKGEFIFEDRSFVVFLLCFPYRE